MTASARPTEESSLISGKSVLITGGTAGIGLGIARHFCARGADVVITGRRSDGPAIAASIGAKFVRMDLCTPGSISSGIEQVADQLRGSIDVLILNAGVDRETGAVDALDMHAFRSVFEVNVFALVQCLRDALAYMTDRASVIITSSPAASLAAPGMSAYGASKAAVNHLTRVFAAELAARGIRVNAILPGIVESEMQGSTASVEFVRRLTLTGTVRRPEELGRTFEFLASEAAAPITGAIVAADDGLSAALSAEAVAAIDADRGAE